VDPCDDAVIELASELADLCESLTEIDEIRKLMAAPWSFAVTGGLRLERRRSRAVGLGGAGALAQESRAGHRSRGVIERQERPHRKWGNSAALVRFECLHCNGAKLSSKLSARNALGWDAV